VPYVPAAELHRLPRDVVRFEPRSALDGGPDGCAVLRRAAAAAAGLLRPGGSLLLELGGDEAELLEPELRALGFSGMACRVDEDGDVRGITCRR
jgi:release factor glutamine methyltransferase